ncbi:30S ribosomal protein S18 [bacterium]|nr:30S ribosomal protein S18 [bacterium]
MRKAKRDLTPKVTKAAKSAIDHKYVFSYKNVEVLKNFVTGQGMIMPRVKTGLTQKQQRQLAIEIKRARHLALLPFVQNA